MRNSVWFRFLCICVVCMLVLTGCGSKRISAGDVKANKTYIYCTDSKRETLYAVEYNPVHSSYVEVIGEYLSGMKNCGGADGYMSVLPEGLTLRSYLFENGVLTLDFNAVYNTMDDAEEAVTRSAIALTMLQIPQVESLLITVDGNALENSLHRTIPAMDSESVLLDWNVVSVEEEE